MVEIYDSQTGMRIEGSLDFGQHASLHTPRDNRVYVVEPGNSSIQRRIRVFEMHASTYRLVSELTLAWNSPVLRLEADRTGSRILVSSYNEGRIVDIVSGEVVWQRSCGHCTFGLTPDARIVVFAGRFDTALWPQLIGVISVDDPGHAVTFSIPVNESATLNDLSPDGMFAAISTTNNGRVYIMPVTLDAARFKPAKILDSKTYQSVVGAYFRGNRTMITVAGDNNVRFWSAR